ncbi:MAG: hypothetical protein HY926_08095 [Elusimicrobia bacterium]|nr:hypothetical protein [Elusimicrobiota bacterium]
MPEKPSYMGAALKRPENIIGMAGLCIAGALFNPGFLFLAGAAELAYLWALVSNPRFRRAVDSQSSALRRFFDAKEKDRLLLRLPGEERDRYLQLAAIRQRVYESWQSRDAVAQGLLQPSVDKLDYLLDTFLRAQITLSAMQEHLMDSDKSKLERQIRAIDADIKRGLPDKLRDAKTRSLGIFTQRLARLNKLENDLEVLRTQLDNIEQTIKLVSDQSISLSDPQQVAGQIDGAVAEVGEAERSLNEVESFLGAAQEEDKKDAAAQQQAQQEQG